MPTGQSSVDSSSLRLSSQISLDCVRVTVKLSHPPKAPSLVDVERDLICPPKVMPAVASWSFSSAFQDDTISINHNWVNGCNLAHMWRFLQQELQAVQQEVREWKDSMPDWHHHCQVGSTSPG